MWFPKVANNSFSSFCPRLTLTAPIGFVSNKICLNNQENISSCPEPSRKRPKSLGDDETMLCKRVVTKDRRYITQITCYEKGADGQAGKPISRTPMRMPLFGKQGGGVLSSLFSKIGRQGEVSAFARDPTAGYSNDWIVSKYLFGFV